jgi:hypothetical protein
METIERQKASPRDVFTHLLAIVTLYISAVSLGTILFQFVNLAFPDVLQGTGSWATDAAHSTMRFAIASLVVVFPVYLFTMRHLSRSYAANPSKRDLRIRKWLVYLTLFIAALVMIGDLISVINNFLQGELTTRIFLKVVVVLAIAGAVFFYYFSDLKRHHEE